jgi:hypothetical protein
MQMSDPRNPPNHPNQGWVEKNFVPSEMPQDIPQDRPGPTEENFVPIDMPVDMNEPDDAGDSSSDPA